MKNYITPELEMLRIAELGDIITYSDSGTLAEIGMDGEDNVTFGSPNTNE